MPVPFLLFFSLRGDTSAKFCCFIFFLCILLFFFDGTKSSYSPENYYLAILQLKIFLQKIQPWLRLKQQWMRHLFNSFAAQTIHQGQRQLVNIFWFLFFYLGEGRDMVNPPHTPPTQESNSGYFPLCSIGEESLSQGYPSLVRLVNLNCKTSRDNLDPKL